MYERRIFRYAAPWLGKRFDEKRVTAIELYRHGRITAARGGDYWLCSAKTERESDAVIADATVFFHERNEFHIWTSKQDVDDLPTVWFFDNSAGAEFYAYLFKKIVPNVLIASRMWTIFPMTQEMRDPTKRYK